MKVVLEGIPITFLPRSFLAEWGTTIRELCKMFETTPREGIESREEVEKNLELVQRDLPLAFDVPCENIDHTKAGDW